MLLYWGMFTTGFIIGAILSLMMFMGKSQDDPDYKDSLGTNPSNNANATSLGANKAILNNISGN